MCKSIADRAEGVPLYIEELTLTLLEGHNARDLDEVPKTLQACLGNVSTACVALNSCCSLVPS